MSEYSHTERDNYLVKKRCHFTLNGHIQNAHYGDSNMEAAEPELTLLVLETLTKTAQPGDTNKLPWLPHSLSEFGKRSISVNQ